MFPLKVQYFTSALAGKPRSIFTVDLPPEATVKSLVEEIRAKVPGAPEHLAICYRECILDELLEVPFRQMGIPEGSQVKAFGSAKPLAEDPFGSVLYQLWKRNAIDRQSNNLHKAILALPELLDPFKGTSQLFDQALAEPRNMKDWLRQFLNRNNEISKIDKEQKPILVFSAQVEKPALEAIVRDFSNFLVVSENLLNAQDDLPELLGSVHMLYISCKVNGVPCQAFVDTGAQMTLISHEFTKRAGIEHLIDRAHKVLAVGVGQQQTVGRIHLADLHLTNDQESNNTVCLYTSFHVIDQPMDVLLGLDMLRRHQCEVDLHKGVLRVGDFETAFLSEAQVDKSKTIGGRTGSPELRSGGGAPDNRHPDGSASSPALLRRAPGVADPSAAGGPPVAEPAPAPGPGSRDDVYMPSQEQIQQLVASGVPADIAIQLLSFTNGDVALAMNLFLDMS
ncbi:hypothetical protein H696_00994 [Fonticula alba]|uniref:UBA domain-containing protein n=1 Tax=Fonticula alba TaxID=691883 RepID=A0A058ZGG7_FONAL|nr:hypothetical protein H696_00994 [Fonticula alba]KCV73460.1 hypothetical protein H696_00994 [Fonticula alba]|eukprot:XP_009493161.1 hypothetical protein H696_00994 [Fonticula alba]